MITIDVALGAWCWLASCLLVAALTTIYVLRARLEQLNRLTTIVNGTHYASIVTDASRRILWVNEAFTRDTGYTLAEAQGRNPGSLLQCEQSNPETIAAMRRALESGSGFRGEIVNRTKSGQHRCIDLEIIPIFDQRRGILGFASLQRDITDRKRLEAELQESQALFNGALDASNFDIAILDEHGTILFVNEAWTHVTEERRFLAGRLKVGCNYFDLVKADDSEERALAMRAVEGIKSVLDGLTEHLEFEYSTVGSSGIEWFLLSVNRFRTPGPPRAVISHENITARKVAQQRALNKQEKLRSIYHASSDGILLISQQGIFDCNEKSLKLLGFGKSEHLQGKQIWELAAPELANGYPSGPAIRQTIQQALEAGETRFELTMQRSDGTQFPAELMLTTFLYDSQRLLLVTFRDISERKLSEARLQQMNQRLQDDLAARTEAERQIRETTAYLDVYRKIVDTHAIVAETDTKGTIVSVNDAFCRISGYSREELIGQNHRILNSGTHTAETWREMYRCVAQGGIWHGELCNRAKNGQLYWVDTTIAPLYKEGGKLRGYFAIRADITSLKIAQTQAEAASHSKSEFLANMSHEIRTPMTAILGYTDLLTELGTCEHCMNSTQAAQAIEAIQRNGEHLLAIINDILDISKIEADKMTVELMQVDVSEFVTDVLTTMQVKSQAKGLALKCELATTVPQSIVTDPTRLRQILVNLIGNSIKFTEHGEVVLRLSSDPTQPELLYFAVNDSGIGMTPEQRGRLFQAFEQADTSMTRRFGGTGLGLRISKRLANMLGGDITVESQPGIGSCFTVSIATGTPVGKLMPSNPQPASTARQRLPDGRQSQVAAATGHSSDQRLPLASIRILLVEDGPDNQRLIMHHLKKAGASVHLACNGKLAVEAMTVDGHVDGPLATPQPFDLVLMDMQMPEMDGREATSLLRHKGATLPIIALTAHALQGDLQMCLEAGCNSRITKPIDRAHLIEECRTHVDRFQQPLPETYATDLVPSFAPIPGSY